MNYAVIKVDIHAQFLCLLFFSLSRVWHLALEGSAVFMASQI